jgi:hypothetical protein
MLGDKTFDTQDFNSHWIKPFKKVYEMDQDGRKMKRKIKSTWKIKKNKDGTEYSYLSDRTGSSWTLESDSELQDMLDEEEAKKREYQQWKDKPLTESILEHFNKSIMSESVQNKML